MTLVALEIAFCLVVRPGDATCVQQDNEVWRINAMRCLSLCGVSQAIRRLRHCFVWRRLFSACSVFVSRGESVDSGL